MEVVKKKKRSSKVIKGTEPYEHLETLIEILKENLPNKKLTPKERVYLFNELDLMLSEGIDIKLLIKSAEYRNGGLGKISNYRNFDVDMASWIERAHKFLQEVEMCLSEGRVATKYEFYVEGKVIIPTKEQEDFVKDYLKQKGIPVNENTYSLALRRLIVGGDIESKFGSRYFIDRTNKRKDEQENAMNV